MGITKCNGGGTSWLSGGDVGVWVSGSELKCVERKDSTMLWTWGLQTSAAWLAYRLQYWTFKYSSAHYRQVYFIVLMWKLRYYGVADFNFADTVHCTVDPKLLVWMLTISRAIFVTGLRLQCYISRPDGPLCRPDPTAHQIDPCSTRAIICEPSSDGWQVTLTGCQCHLEVLLTAISDECQVAVTACVLLEPTQRTIGLGRRDSP